MEQKDLGMNYTKQKCMEFSQSVFIGGTYNSLVIEACKGSIAEVFPYPVKLEPAFEKFDAMNVYKKGESTRLAEPATENESWSVCKLKIPKLEKIEWEKFEAVILSLSAFDGIASFAERGRV
jgi:hypothetical protein